jgi:hypothetical protein
MYIIGILVFKVLSQGHKGYQEWVKDFFFLGSCRDLFPLAFRNWDFLLANVQPVEN